jgi:protein-tyrosine phosphatase
VLDVLWKVQADFLEAALQVVQTDHGGVDRYLEQSLGLGPARRKRLQQLYLEP